MGRFRSFLRRAARPAAMVAVVGTVSLSLVVSTPSTAQALTARDVKAAETFVMGATKTIAPAANVAMAAGSFTPVGFGIRLAQLGFLAYSTSDIWWPFVAGAFGAAGDAATEGPSATTGIRPGYRILSYSVAGDKSSFTVRMAYDGRTSTSFSPQYGVVAKCKRASDGAIFYGKRNGYWSTNSGSFELSTTIATPCRTGETAVGWHLGGGGGTRGDTIKYQPLIGATGAGQYAQFDGTAAGFGATENVISGGEMGGGSFDPYGADVKYKVRSECIDAAGVKSIIEAESSGDYMRMPSCAAAGKGHGTGKNTIIGVAPGATTEQTLWDSPAAPSDPATPLCDASRPTGGCVLSVELDGKQCEAGNVECENWAEIQKNEPNNTRLKCRFGPYTLPMASCAALERAYRIGGAPATKENTDGDPDTSSFQTPQNTPLAQPVPTTTGPGTTTGTVPGSSGQPAPAPSGSPDAKMANCFPTGWAMFNPVEWVLKPVRCAFEPTQTQAQIQARANGVMTLAQGKAPISFITNLTMTGPSGGGCPNWTINVGGLSENVVCESSFTAAILSVRAPLFGLVATAMVWPLLRSIWYAAIPVLRVTPSSGGK